MSATAQYSVDPSPEPQEISVRFRVDALPAIQDMGLFRTNDLWVHMDRVLNSDVLIFVRKGNVHIMEGNWEYDIRPGQVFLMKHGIRHYGHKKTEAGSEWYWITFAPVSVTVPGEPRPCEDSRKHEELPSPLQLSLKWLEVEDVQRTCMTFTKLLNHYTRGTAYDRVKLQVGVLDLLIDLHHELNTRTETSLKLITDIKKYVQHHIHDDIRSKELARALQMRFSRATGISIQKYVMEQKMKEAIRLFSESTFNISQVSEKLGYLNAYYFTRVFKQVTGFSPTAFLKRGYYDYSSKGDQHPEELK
jgi:AraC family transcriptional regulator of arabinose operon